MPDVAKTGPDADDILRAVIREYEADVIVYTGDINEDGFGQLVKSVLAGKSKENVILMIRTPGGSANSAYKIARFLQKVYSQFFIYTPSYCKSAGTIVALGAHKLIMDPFSELGPLDVQLLKANELGARKSGLITRSAFEGLAEASFELFESFAIGIMRKSGGLISFRVAAEISSQATSGIIAGMYSKIDPENVGSDKRDLDVAFHYGARLVETSRNADLATVYRLINTYPSHDFIIDDEEAQKLFENVEPPSESLMMLSGMLTSQIYNDSDEVMVQCLTIDSDKQEAADDQATTNPEAVGANERDKDVGEGGIDDQRSDPASTSTSSAEGRTDDDAASTSRGSIIKSSRSQRLNTESEVA